MSFLLERGFAPETAPVIASGIILGNGYWYRLEAGGMDQANTPGSLTDALRCYDMAYLLTSTAGGAPHVVAVTSRVDGNDLVVEGGGKRSRANLAARPKVAVLWPPRNASEYSLIVDGTARMSGESLRILPTRAVLTRSSGSPRSAPSGGCSSDCIELALGSASEAAGTAPPD